eukprot:7384452-Prymnesium_polylepis.2
MPRRTMLFPGQTTCGRSACAIDRMHPLSTFWNGGTTLMYSPTCDRRGLRACGGEGWRAVSDSAHTQPRAHGPAQRGGVA